MATDVNKPHSPASREIDPTPLPPAKLAHFVLRCRHFEQTLAWYKTVLAAHVAFENSFIAFLSYDQEHHRVALVNIGPDAPKVSPGAGVDHIAFTMTDVSALMNHYHRLKTDGITPAWCVHHGGTLSIYYADPEGVRCEFQVELFDDPANFSDLMTGEAFTANPIGIEYDPESLLQRYLAGESDDRLLDQTLLN